MAYTDLTAEFDYKDLLTYQNMDKLAANDAYVLIPSGTIMAFYQAAAPTGWTKQTTTDDACLRVTSGAGAGTGGTIAISTGIPLAHTHAQTGHNHTLLHTHLLDYDVVSLTVGGNGFVSLDTDGAGLALSGAGSVARRSLFNRTHPGTGGTSGTDTGASDSQLSNAIFQYIDIVVCTKV